MDAKAKYRRIETLLRVTVDFVLLSVSLLFSAWLNITVRVLATGNEQLVLNDLSNTFYAYIFATLTISCSSILFFVVSGVYSKANKLSVQSKALYMFSGNTASFGIFALASSFFGYMTAFNTKVLLSAWIVATCVLVASRAWSTVWRKMTIRSVNNNVLPHYTDHKTVLVIGGAGYIGSALIPKLLSDGYKVRVLDMLVYGEDAISPYLSHPRLELMKADFRHVDAVVNAVKGMSTVIHLGAIVGDPACALDENMTIEINLMATRMIAEVCKGFGVKRFIFASTCSVYGASDKYLDESSSLNPVSLYAKSKIACEQVLQQMSDDQFIPVILRFSTIFGLSGRMRFDLVVNLLSAKSMLDRQITVINGDQWRPFLHVDDAALSVFSVLKAPLSKVRNQVFNVGDDRLNYTIKQVGEIIKSKVPQAELLDLESDQDRRNYRVSFDKIKGATGFQTQWNLEQGIDQVLDAVRSGSVTSYKEPKYSNASFLKGAELYKDHAAYYNLHIEEFALSN